MHDKVVSNIQEVRARGARTIVLAEEDDTSVADYADVLIPLPKVMTILQPLLAIIPLQLFACEIATALGHDVDQPPQPGQERYRRVSCACPDGASGAC